METKQYCFDYTACSDSEKLPGEDRALIARAREACAGAHAPYSHLRVGAALRFAGGEMLAANNQESEAFPSGMCAERALLYFALGNHPGRRIEALAVASNPAKGVCTPCGACRQIIYEAEKRQSSPIRVIMAGAASATVAERAADLLPFAFHLD